MGSEPVFDVEKIPDEALTGLAELQKQGRLVSVLLGSPDLSRFLPLYPFVIWDECPHCSETKPLGLTEEVFLFSGVEGRKYLAFVGVVHSRVVSEPVKSHAEEVFTEKEVPPTPIKVDELSYPILYGRGRRQSDLWLNENIFARRYIPNIYHQRSEIERELKAFLEGRKAGFLLLGETGVGKTSLLCRKVEEWQERGEIVIFYAGHQLQVDESMEDRLLRDMILSGEFPKLMELLRRWGKKLILVVDGVNEHHEPMKLLEQLCAFVRRYGRDYPLKVVISVRTTYFARMLRTRTDGMSEEQARSVEAGLFPSTLFQTHLVEREGRREETYRFELERFGEDDLKGVYEAYRKYDGYYDAEGNLRRFCPKTAYESLTNQVRQVLRHPWYLRMTMEVYDGKFIPQTLWVGEILNQFAAAKIYGRTGDEQIRFQKRA